MNVVRTSVGTICYSVVLSHLAAKPKHFKLTFAKGKLVAIDKGIIRPGKP